MADITNKDAIGEVIARKGPKAGRLMDDLFCVKCEGKNGVCCPQTSLTLKAAGILRETNPVDINNLLVRINRLPDLK